MKLSEYEFYLRFFDDSRNLDTWLVGMFGVSGSVSAEASTMIKNCLSECLAKNIKAVRVRLTASPIRISIMFDLKNKYMVSKSLKVNSSWSKNCFEVTNLPHSKKSKMTRQTWENQFAFQF